MGCIGSGRRPRDKSKVTIEDYRERAEKKAKRKPEGRLYSVPAHVDEIRLSGACRFRG